MQSKLAVYLETGTKRVFAVAVVWPGWARSARGEDEALAALVAYGPRYGAVVSRTGIPFDPPGDPDRLEVVERLLGASGTDFGVPGEAPSADGAPLTEVELQHQLRLLQASWAAFDEAARSAMGVELRKGPRGGGRDLDKIISHVLEAEDAYLRQLGSRPPSAANADPMARMARIRDRTLEALTARARGTPLPDPARTRTLWVPRYHVRRSAWHALDHAWEIEDRATQG